MHSAEILSLLKDVRENLTFPRFLWRRRRLLGRLDAYLHRWEASPHPAIAFARKRSESAASLRIDIDEISVEKASNGFWVRSWVWVDQKALLCFELQRLSTAREILKTLPPRTRAVFLAHCIDDLPYQTIATDLGISVQDVQREFAAAMLALSIAIDPD
ncbi:sigma-70 region 4 domain-containing protein [Sphingobium sp. BHU LFT2]|uniref:sigma-70 region 4 domain-containing protein n=1 Tax=Sphingobium sp. BHU LFT2 TaxID=2807634 RepID=UPI001BEA4A65|nr:sigma-70 region 4 domain-containing protein [Sphingobium sp. BHU LFT2]MBT2246850.1 sigma-70 region 4 domain-containing protein [Sphingobium sp. BHU LFT2]